MEIDNAQDVGGDVDLLTEQEVARMTRVGRSTLRTWRARREGPPFIQLGARTPRYPRDELRRWIRERLSTFIVDNK